MEVLATTTMSSKGQVVIPEAIRNRLGLQTGAQFVVVGDARKYLTALINVDMDMAKVVAEEKGIKFHQPEDLLDDPAFKAVLDEILAANNKRLASVETIKYYRILKTPLSAATGELSVKLSVKRDVVQKKYADVINSMYKD